jgi:hypothetical protein
MTRIGRKRSSAICCLASLHRATAFPRHRILRQKTIRGHVRMRHTGRAHPHGNFGSSSDQKLECQSKWIFSDWLPRSRLSRRQGVPWPQLTRSSTSA